MNINVFVSSSLWLSSSHTCPAMFRTSALLSMSSHVDCVNDLGNICHEYSCWKYILQFPLVHGLKSAVSILVVWYVPLVAAQKCSLKNQTKNKIADIVSTTLYDIKLCLLVIQHIKYNTRVLIACYRIIHPPYRLILTPFKSSNQSNSHVTGRYIPSG